MDNSTHNWIKVVTGAPNAPQHTYNGWARGDDDSFFNLSHFSQFKVEKNYNWGKWSVVGKKLDGEEIYIKTLETWGACSLWLINVMEGNNGRNE